MKDLRSETPEVCHGDDATDERAARVQHLPPRTDAGNAELFARLLKDKLRFDHHRKRWLVWAGHWWTEDREGAILRLAKSVVRLRAEIADRIYTGKAQDEEWKWAKRSEARSRLEAMLALAQSEHQIADRGNRWDSDPWLLGVANGVVDLRTGALRDGRPEDRITLHSRVPFDAAAGAPRWERFLEEIFEGDQEVVDFVTRAVGYTLTGLTSEQVFFACWGDGSNGKTTFLEILRGVLGDYAYNAPFSMLDLTARSAIPNDVAALVNRRLVTGSETSELSRWNEQRVKVLTGSDDITARFLYNEFFTFTPIAKFWLASNHKPMVDDDSHGFWRRVRLVPFQHRFDGEKADRDLMKKLRAESSGILAWAVRGCLRWQREGLGVPTVVKDATEAYRKEADLVGEFLEERCVVDPEAHVTVSAVWAEFAEWARENGEKMDRRVSPIGSRPKASAGRGSAMSG